MSSIIEKELISFQYFKFQGVYPFNSFSSKIQQIQYIIDNEYINNKINLLQKQNYERILKDIRYLLNRKYFSDIEKKKQMELDRKRQENINKEIKYKEYLIKLIEKQKEANKIENERDRKIRDNYKQYIMSFNLHKNQKIYFKF